MAIYYLMIEAIPHPSNPESNQYGGAYVNCWVNASSQKDALKRVKEHLKEENWKFVKMEDLWVAQRHLYVDAPESLECYDEACRNGFCSIFYTWPIDENLVN